MRKKIIILSGIIIGIMLIAAGYLSYRESEKPSGEPMTKEICEASGGEWSEMEILKDEGDVFKYFCVCPKTDPQEIEIWINEGEARQCP